MQLGLRSGIRVKSAAYTHICALGCPPQRCPRTHPQPQPPSTNSSLQRSYYFRLPCTLGFCSGTQREWCVQSFVCCRVLPCAAVHSSPKPFFLTYLDLQILGPDTGNVATYVFILLGTLMVAQVQPVYMNLPTGMLLV